MLSQLSYTPNRFAPKRFAIIGSGNSPFKWYLTSFFS